MMARIWNTDSSVAKKLALLTNLILLNVLWLLCCIPVITAGASTAAMYSVSFAYHKGETDSVLKPFFRAFRKCFRQSTVFWVIFLLLAALLFFDVMYLLSLEHSLLWLPVALVAALAVIAASYVFPQIALFDNTLPSMIRSSFSLFILNLIPSVTTVLVNLFPWAMLLFLPKLFLASLILWTLIGFSASAYLNSYLLLKIFQKYMPQSD